MTIGDEGTDTPRVLRVALIGAGAAGRLYLEVIFADQEKLGFQPVVLVDDDSSLIGESINGIPVDGPISRLPEISKAHHLDLALITIPSAPGNVIKRIVSLCTQAGIRYRVVPPAYTNLQIAGLRRPRRVAIEDLLSLRPKYILNSIPVSSLKSECVLVTGAAGSIGSEIVNQLVSIPPRILVALDISESGLYDLECDLRRLNPNARVEVVLCDVKNKIKLSSVFAKYQPTLIFHTAAYKHVPMLESYPEEAVGTNILGTLNLMESAIGAGKNRMVVISTDKAVEPCNVMGMTKRLVEILASCLSTETNEILVVRFGNVLESNGSVIPLFRKQIADGGPVTVTHPDVERYFMTTSEAAQLVIQAALLGSGAHTYVLQMGEQRKILDIARDMIRLSGLKEGSDIEIVFTGLRPGEKLTEKLFAEREQQRLIGDSLTYEIKDNGEVDCVRILKDTKTLLDSYQQMDSDGIRRFLRNLVVADELNASD